MAKGDIVFYRQKQYKVMHIVENGWMLIKRGFYDPIWVHESSAMLLKAAHE